MMNFFRFVPLFFIIALPSASFAGTVEAQAPHVLQEEGQDVAAAIVGKWTMTKMQAGEDEQEVEEGTFVAEFLADGKMKTYENGVASDAGTYTIEGNTLTVYIDGDGEGEASTVSIDGDTMTVSQELTSELILNITFKRVVE